MTKVAVIGDVGGHLKPLRAELVRLGADPQTLALPPDLVVVQVGDLVHRGPASDGVVELVDAMLASQPDQWRQLCGNHEAQYLREPAFDWPETIGGVAADRLRAWWAEGRMRPAVAVESAGEQYLITHAGLTSGFWQRVLAAPPSAQWAAAGINSLAGGHEDVLFSWGEMLGGGPPNLMAGPVWASAAAELVPSWLLPGIELPFSLVHGHSSLVDWRRSVLRTDEQTAERVDLDLDASHVVVHVGAHRIVGVDPGHGRRARRPWQALVLEDARLLESA